MVIVIAGLRCGQLPLHATAVDSHGSTGFHSVGREPELAQLFGNTMRCRLGHTPTGCLYLAHMHQSVEKRTGSEHHSLGIEPHTHGGGHTTHLTILNNQSRGGILPHIQVGRIFQRPAPQLTEAHTVTLGTRAPHSRTLGAVEHAELYRRTVSDYSHHSAQRIYFPDNLPFSYTTNGGITAHLGYLVHIYSNKECRRTGACRSRRRFTTGMAGPNYYHIVIETHILMLFQTVQ